MQGETVNHFSQSSNEPVIDNPEQALRARREALRQGYLEAMGIQAWFPRYQLTNARSPRPFDWITEDAKTFTRIAVPHTTADRQSTQEESQPGYAPTKPADILEQFMVSSKPVEETRPADQPAPQAVSQPAKQLSGSSSKFRLVIQSVSEDCLVVAEMPHSGLNQFSRYHQRLLGDILRALKLNPEGPQSYREFVWPMAGNRGLLSQLNQDDYAAADAVCAYLSNQYGLPRRKVILLLGQSAARFIMDPEKDFEQLRGIRQGTHNHQWFAVTHGLNELMKQSVLKQEAWQDLSPLLSITPQQPMTPHNSESDMK